MKPVDSYRTRGKPGLTGCSPSLSVVLFVHHAFGGAYIASLRLEGATPLVLKGGDSQSEMQQTSQPRDLAIYVRV